MTKHRETSQQSNTDKINADTSANKLKRLGRTIGVGGAAISLALLAACNTGDGTPQTVTPRDTVPASATLNATNLDQALETQSADFLNDRSMGQLLGTATVNKGANVRTTPVVENDGDGNTNVAYISDGSNSLENPIIVEDTANPVNGPWYGAKNKDGNIYWVSTKGITLEGGIKIKNIPDASEFDVSTTNFG